MLLIKECISTRAPLRSAAASYSELVFKRTSVAASLPVRTRRRGKVAASANKWVTGASVWWKPLAEAVRSSMPQHTPPPRNGNPVDPSNDGRKYLTAKLAQYRWPEFARAGFRQTVVYWQEGRAWTQPGRVS